MGILEKRIWLFLLFSFFIHLLVIAALGVRVVGERPVPVTGPVFINLVDPVPPVAKERNLPQVSRESLLAGERAAAPGASGAGRAAGGKGGTPQAGGLNAESGEIPRIKNPSGDSFVPPAESVDKTGGGRGMSPGTEKKRRDFDIARDLAGGRPQAGTNGGGESSGLPGSASDSGGGSRAGEGGNLPFLDEAARERLSKSFILADKDKDVNVDQVSINTQDLQFMSYMIRLRERVQMAWHYPLTAQANGWQGTVHVLFVLDGDGGLAEVKLLDSSGYEVLNKAVLTALKKAAPFGELPKVWGLDYLAIQGEFVYTYNYMTIR